MAANKEDGPDKNLETMINQLRVEYFRRMQAGGSQAFFDMEMVLKIQNGKLQHGKISAARSIKFSEKG